VDANDAQGHSPSGSLDAHAISCVLSVARVGAIRKQREKSQREKEREKGKGREGNPAGQTRIGSMRVAPCRRLKKSHVLKLQKLERASTRGRKINNIIN